MSQVEEMRKDLESMIRAGDSVDLLEQLQELAEEAERTY